MKEPDLFALELRSLAEVRREYPNVHLMIPFVRTAWEFAECKRLIDASPLGVDRELELWVMAEVPSVLYWLPEYVRRGVRGISIGSNDLTQLMLGVDRDSTAVAPLFDERDGAVLDMIARLIEESHRLGITCSICGQAPSVHQHYAERLVEWGIDSISVNPDAVERTRHAISAAEQRLILNAARGGRIEHPARTRGDHDGGRSFVTRTRRVESAWANPDAAVTRVSAATKPSLRSVALWGVMIPPEGAFRDRRLAGRGIAVRGCASTSITIGGRQFSRELPDLL